MNQHLTFAARMQKIIYYTVTGYLALLILVKMFAMPVVCIDYALNKEYIASTLCENKAKPQMHCNGQCHLKKQLAKTTENTDATDHKGSVKTASIDFCQELKSISFIRSVEIISAYNNPPVNFYVSGYNGTIFHPPTA